VDESTEERIARTDARFRDANEQILAAAREYEIVDSVPFICECGDRSCHAVARMSLDAYEEVRSDPRRFFTLPGHEVADGGGAEVLVERDGYVIVEKQGRAGEVAEVLDTREGGRE
jgi:hypothetical protein